MDLLDPGALNVNQAIFDLDRPARDVTVETLRRAVGALDAALAAANRRAAGRADVSDQAAAASALAWAALEAERVATATHLDALTQDVAAIKAELGL